MPDVSGEPPKDVGPVSPSVAESHEKKASLCVAERVDRYAGSAQGRDLGVGVHVEWQLQGDRCAVNGVPWHCFASFK
ncbi:hypothetical protein ACSFA3_25680, partial [Variovorax sp. RHLX14]|uniref:hypothetical protein n=1 Tax=Variovorax sp. RHLX14 TaxID=1259731 RepID=UPI003F473190